MIFLLFVFLHTVFELVILGKKLRKKEGTKEMEQILSIEFFVKYPVVTHRSGVQPTQHIDAQENDGNI